MKKILSILSILLLPIFSASADVSGRWSCHFDLSGSGDYPQDLLLTQSGGTVTGTEVYAGTTNVFANITGTISGSSIQMHMQYTSLNYYADVTGTVSGTSMTGTWNNQSQQGGFICTQTSSTGGGGGNPTPTATPVGQSAKRPTATFLFCNRTGVGLSTADCAVTVGDAGGFPRTTPSGTVSLDATNGFFPAKGACALQPTQYSPGVASCKAEFAIPFGFPLGVPFPIDATYPGDATFQPSSTAHKNIDVACVGDSTHPCSGNVALTFADWPQIIKNILAPVFECGNISKTSSNLRGLFGDIGKCAGTIVTEAKLGEVLSKMNLGQIMNLAGAVSNKDASTDSLLKALQAIDDPKYAPTLQNITNIQDELKRQSDLSDLIRKILNDQSKQTINTINNMRVLRASTSKKKTDVFTIGTAPISVKNNSRKPVRVKLTKTAQKIVAGLKKAGVGDLNVTIKIKGQRSSGPKKPFNKTTSAIVGLS